MTPKPESENLDDYLRRTDVVDFDVPDVALLAGKFKAETDSVTELVRAAYEFVRDKISHSADIEGKCVTCRASEVLAAGEGICFAKSHLLAALLRANGIPCGFFYQRLRMVGDDPDSKFVLHGLNTVYIQIHKGIPGSWIPLDARGNKDGINARFSLSGKFLAFTIRTDLGETEYATIYSEPVREVITALSSHKTFDGLWANLPAGISVDEQ